MMTYRITFESPDGLRPIEVAASSPQDDRLAAAVLDLVRQRWPGAPLHVRVNRHLFCGRIFAGGSVHGRVVGWFTLEPTEMSAQA